MRLLRYILLSLLLTLLFSCEKDSSLETPHPISFSPSISVETKAVSPAVSIGNTVSLFGIRMVNAVLDPPIFVNGQTLTRNQNNTWTYSPVKNWEATGNYYFAAVWPSDQQLAQSQLNGSSISIIYQVGTNRNNDLMLARANRDPATQGFGSVSLLFEHTCSAVRFLIGKSSDATNYVLSSFRLISLETNGTLTVPLTSTSPTVIADGWHLNGMLGNLFSWTAETQQQYKTINHPSNQNNPDQYDVQMGWYYMLPQTMSSSSAVEFSIRKVTNEGGNVTYGPEIVTRLSIEDRDGIQGIADRWIPNDVYNYYITITQKGATITVETTSWDEVQATTETVTFEPIS